MADVFSKQKRSEVMSKIRGSGNKDTELAMINVFRKNRISGWRRKVLLIGKPDFTFRKQRVVVFVDGCFWHGCKLHSTLPENNRPFWEKKLKANKARDKFVTSELTKLGWKVVRIWEHEFKKPDAVALKILKHLTQS